MIHRFLHLTRDDGKQVRVRPEDIRIYSEVKDSIYANTNSETKTIMGLYPHDSQALLLKSTVKEVDTLIFLLNSELEDEENKE